MNISSALAPRQAVSTPSVKAHTLGETRGVGQAARTPSPLAEDTLSTRHHAVSPLKVMALHGAIMASEQGLHLVASKGASVSQAAAGKWQALGDISGAVASGYLAYSALDHALQAADAGNTQAATAYTVSAVLDAGLAVANTLSLLKKGPAVSAGVSLGVGLLSTASAVWGAKLEQTQTKHP